MRPVLSARHARHRPRQQAASKSWTTPLAVTRRLAPSCLSFLLFAVLIAPPVHADDVAAYLERHGLSELLAVHLEQQLEQAGDDEAEQLIVRLAEIYARLLERVSDPAKRVDLEDRARRLLVRAPQANTDELALALLRARYRSAETVAENHRMRLASPEEVERARQTLSEIIPELTSLMRRAEHQLELAERRIMRASGSESVLLAEDAQQARRTFDEATFLSAWALYYQSWLHDRRENARGAEKLFARLLDFGETAALPENVSVDLRSVEAIARSILGMALCRSLTSSSATALSWLALLEHPQTFEPLRVQAPAWKMVIHLEHDEYLATQAMLNEAGAEAEVPLHWLRLAAVHALEDAPQSEHAEALARRTVTELASRGELQHVFDLAERYGIEALRSSGFALRYVDGVLTYYRARQVHGSEEPTADPEALAAYDAAAEDFLAALAQEDVKQYPAAAADCRRLIAWCHYFSGELIEAKALFEEAAERLPAEEASEALWMAIVCLDRLVEAADRSAALEAELDQLMQRFLDRYPSSEHAPRLVLRRAAGTPEATIDAVDQLLAIPPHSDVYENARRQAAQMLYRLFRAKSGPQRVAIGNKYLSVALPLFTDDLLALDPSDDRQLQRVLVRGRRILEVSLNKGIGRLIAARTVLAAFEDLQEGPGEALEEIEMEIIYRQVQERLLSQETEEAARLADRMHELDPGDVWTRLANRSLFALAERQRRDPAGAEMPPELARDLVVLYGSRIIEEAGGSETLLRDSNVLPVAVAVAEAALQRWQQRGDREDGLLALKFYETLLELKPRDAAFLRATALLSEQFERTEQALEAWRLLVAGAAEQSEIWFEAKFHLIELLAESDPARAREVMNQHKLLNPEYGPEPWGPRLRALDRRLEERKGSRTREPENSRVGKDSRTGEPGRDRGTRRGLVSYGTKEQNGGQGSPKARVLELSSSRVLEFFPLSLCPST